MVATQWPGEVNIKCDCHIGAGRHSEEPSKGRYHIQHQENNMLLGPLEVLESAGLTGVARSSFKIL